MIWHQHQRWYRARPNLPAMAPVDEDAFYGTPNGFGIIEILHHTGEFDNVYLSWSPLASRTTSRDRVSVTVIPSGATQPDDGSQQVVLRTVSYRLVVEILKGDASTAWRELDRLQSVCLASLLDTHARAYGGFCLPQESVLQADTFSPVRVPSRSRTLTGSFAYRVSPSGE